jgi:hypothetical protein
MFNQIRVRFHGGLKAFVTDTSLVVCTECLHWPKLATFFANDVQLIIDHYSPTNFGIDRDPASSTSFFFAGSVDLSFIEY